MGVDVQEGGLDSFGDIDEDRFWGGFNIKFGLYCSRVSDMYVQV